MKALALLLVALVLPPKVHHPCLSLAERCRARQAACWAGGGWAVCSRARACVATYNVRCGPWGP